MSEQAYEIKLVADPDANSATLEKLLEQHPPGTLRLPAGEWPVNPGLRIGAGWALVGASGGEETWLTSAPTDDDAPMLHVVGSDVQVRGIGLAPAPSQPDEHSGDRGTAITVGRYLYPEPASWIERVQLSRIRVRRPGERAANSIAVMGAVRDTSIDDLEINGGCTGLAVHWGAVGGSVSTITGPSYHPHRLGVSRLTVADAFEGFYLSSVYDVMVKGARLTNVEIGFRLLPGDNSDRFHPDRDNDVGKHVSVSDVLIDWSGHSYAVRVAGWGRSEVDHELSVLRYREIAVRDCTIRVRPPAAGRSGTWSPILIEQAPDVVLRNVQVESA